MFSYEIFYAYGLPIRSQLWRHSPAGYKNAASAEAQAQRRSASAVHTARRSASKLSHSPPSTFVPPPKTRVATLFACPMFAPFRRCLRSTSQQRSVRQNHGPSPPGHHTTAYVTGNRPGTGNSPVTSSIPVFGNSPMTRYGPAVGASSMSRNSPMTWNSPMTGISPEHAPVTHAGPVRCLGQRGPFGWSSAIRRRLQHRGQQTNMHCTSPAHRANRSEQNQQERTVGSRHLLGVAIRGLRTGNQPDRASDAQCASGSSDDDEFFDASSQLSAVLTAAASQVHDSRARLLILHTSCCCPN